MTTAYLMALTLQAGATYETPDLTTKDQFPNDDFAPQSQATLDSDSPSGEGWYGGPIRVTLTSQDEPGGSGVHQISYRFNGGNPQVYTAPFTFSTEGPHARVPRDRRRRQRRGLQVDPAADRYARARHDPDHRPGAPQGADGWYDGPVEVRFSGADNAGSGVSGTEYRLSDDEDWWPDEDRVLIDEAGLHELQYRSRDVAGNQEAGQTLALKVDPTRRRPRSRSTARRRMRATTGRPSASCSPRDDGEGAGAPRRSTASTAESGRSTRARSTSRATSVHRIDYRSRDVLGNVELYRTVFFRISPLTLTVPAPLPIESAAATRARHRSPRSSRWRPGRRRAPRCAATASLSGSAASPSSGARSA